MPEVSAAQVSRAIALSRLPALELLRNEFVVPHWIGRTNQFWYRREGATGAEWIVVDAASGARRPLYDPAALTAAVAATDHRSSIPLEAPPQVVDVEAVDGQPVLNVRVASRSVRCRVQPRLLCEEATTARDPSRTESPDRSRAAFVRAGNLWVRDLRSGTERQLTRDAEPDFEYATAGYERERALMKRVREGRPAALEGVLWSPDGRRLLVPRIDQRHVAPYPWLESSPVDGSHRPLVHWERIALVGDAPPRWEWWIVDVATGEKRRVTLPADTALVDPSNLFRTEWSRDGERLLTIGAGRRFEARSLFEVDASTGEVRTVLTDRTLANDATSEDLPFRILRAGRQVLWPTVRDDYLHLDLIDVASGRRVAEVTRGPYRVRAILGVDETRGRLYFVANGREAGDPYERRLYSVGLAGDGLRLLTPERGDHQVLDASATNRVELQDETPPYAALSPDMRFLLDAYSTVSEPTRFVVRRAHDGAIVTEYERTDASRLFAAGYRPPERFVAKSADGQHDLWGLVYRPTDFDPRRRYPVLDLQYVSPVAQVAPHNFNGAITRQLHFANSPATAELGFVVAVVDGRGTPFRSQSFSGPRPDFLATMGLDDHIAFIRQIAARDPSLDLDRVGIAGASFGGWTVLRALLQYPEFYAVGVAGTAPGNFYAMPDYPHLTMTAGAPRYADGSSLRGSASETPANWASFDPLAQLDRLRGKLLLVLGEQDEHVLPGSSLQFFDRAVAARKDVWAIQIPNAQHNVVGYPYAMREALSFLLQHLSGRRLPPGAELPSPVPFPLDPRQTVPPPPPAGSAR